MKVISKQKKENLLANAEVKYIKLYVNKISKEVDPHEEMCYLIEDDIKEISFENNDNIL